MDWNRCGDPRPITALLPHASNRDSPHEQPFPRQPLLTGSNGCQDDRERERAGERGNSLSGVSVKHTPSFNLIKIFKSVLTHQHIWSGMRFQKLPDCVFSLGGKQTEECHHSNSRTLQHQNWHHFTLWSPTDEITNRAVYWTFRQNMNKNFFFVEYHIWYIRFHGSYRELSM